MHTLIQDIRYALGQMRRNGTTTIIAILTLGIGIGANTSVLGFVNAVLFKPLSARDPNQLVWLVARSAASPNFNRWAYPDYKAVRDGATSFGGVFAFGRVDMSLGGAEPERISGMVASGNYFEVLGTRLSAGRAFGPDDDGPPGAHAVVVVSHPFWMRRLAGDTTAIGRSLILNGHQYRIIGVAAEGFTGAEIGESNDVWTPIAQLPQLSADGANLLASNYNNFFSVMARLKPGVTTDRAASEVTGIVSHLRPESTRPSEIRSAAAFPAEGGLDPSSRAQVVPVLALITIVPLLVLLVACANVANLFIGRALARRKELAVRRAIGASRARLIRLLITESVVLALAAGAAGVVLASWMTAAINALAHLPADFANTFTPDARVFALTAVIAIVAGVLFGIVPAVTSTSASLTGALKNEGITVGRSRHRIRNAFVIAQASGSLVLLITAGLLVRSLQKALNVEPGFDARNAVAVSYDVSAQNYSADAQAAFHLRLLENVRAIPGVEGAALVNRLPLSGQVTPIEIVREGASERGDGVRVFTGTVSPEYFAAMRIPLVQGREFASSDAHGTPPVAIVNETLAHRLWPGQTALGKRVRLNGEQTTWHEIVGVARDGRYENLMETPQSFYYVAAAQAGLGMDVTLVARRSGGDAATTIQLLRQTFKQLDPNMPMFRVTTLAEDARQSVDVQRAGASLLAVFGALALILTALGIYGVVAHGVTLRTREIGIRMALGAKTAAVLTQFLREGLGLTLIGVGIGTVVSLAGSGLLAGYLFGLAPTDAVTFAFGAVLLSATALVASYFPARRATRVNPIVALRSE